MKRSTGDVCLGEMRERFGRAHYREVNKGCGKSGACGKEVGHD